MGSIGSYHHAPDPIWDDRAACRSSPLGADAWFIPDQSSLQRKAAVQTCNRCPILAACRQWAISDPNIIGGVFGGLSDEDRKAERRRRKKAAKAAAAALAAARQRRRNLQRGYNRRSEKRRRDLGLAESAESQRARYANDPEPQKARAAAYYAEHRTEILARRRKARQASAA